MTGRSRQGAANHGAGLTIWVKLAHGMGAAAFGIKNNGFDYFLLLFYGTVIGLEPGLVGLAILIALVVDAFSDPLVGYWSDHFRSRWGRRHPFMYASALPVALSYFALWNPPDWGQWGLFAYLTLLAVAIRTLITFYETPSSALLPELTRDYDERTALQSYRLLFGWGGGTAMSVVMFGVILPAFGGIEAREGYRVYGIVASALIFISIMVSALGTHHKIPSFSQPKPDHRRKTPRAILAEMFETLNDPSFFALFFAAVFSSIATGIAASLAFILLHYFWGFSEFQIFIWTSSVFVSALLGFVIAPPVARRLGKKRAALTLGIIAFTVAPAPVIARLFGLMPENGDPLLFPLVLGINLVDLALIIALQAISYSMVADLVEASQLRTGRRNEGVYFASMTFTRKTTQGLGVLASGLMLSAIGFPEGEALQEIDPKILWNLGALYAPSLLAVWAATLYFLSRYRISRADHEAHLAALARAAPGPKAQAQD